MNQLELVAASSSERLAWVRAIRKELFLARGGALFGTKLEELIRYTSEATQYLPSVLYDTAEYIRQHGLETEGIFRKCGLHQTIKQLSDAYDTCRPRPILNYPEHDVHAVAGLLKMYLRELPEPVIPYSFYHRFRSLCDDSKEIKPEQLGVVQNLPIENYTVLRFLCKLLQEISQHTQKNKMTADSLARVFTPSILRESGADPDDELSTTSGRTKCVAAMIEQCENIFANASLDLAQLRKETLNHPNLPRSGGKRSVVVPPSQQSLANDSTNGQYKQNGARESTVSLLRVRAKLSDPVRPADMRPQIIMRPNKPNHNNPGSIVRRSTFHENGTRDLVLDIINTSDGTPLIPSTSSSERSPLTWNTVRLIPEDRVLDDGSPTISRRSSPTRLHTISAQPVKTRRPSLPQMLGGPQGPTITDIDTVQDFSSPSPSPSSASSKNNLATFMQRRQQLPTFPSSSSKSQLSLDRIEIEPESTEQYWKQQAMLAKAEAAGLRARLQNKDLELEQVRLDCQMARSEQRMLQKKLDSLQKSRMNPS